MSNDQDAAEAEPTQLDELLRILWRTHSRLIGVTGDEADREAGKAPTYLRAKLQEARLLAGEIQDMVVDIDLLV